jgi:uncharacterized protein
MDRLEAHALVLARLGSGPTFAHCLAAEACMRALALRFGQDPEIWGLAGLAHDLDLDECANDMERHAVVGAAVLEAAGAPAEVVHAVLGHNDKVVRESLLDKALWCVDPTTGFIVAAALVRPSRSTSDLSVKSLKKRMKEQRFAAAVNRDQIRACAEIGLELDDFLTLCLVAMDAIRAELGLEGTPQ